MRKTFVLFVLLAWAAVNADIAAATFGGVTLTITNNDAVRMKKEEVDIYYQGRYAQVKAVFVMENRTGETVSLDIGFPITDLGDPEFMFRDLVKGKESLYDFQVRENGLPVTSIVAQKVAQKIPDRIDKKWLWFAWKQAFPPGETVVDVEYRISPNLSYGDCFKNIYYILSTGALWRSHIGEARISVHFPKAIARVQVTNETTPTGFLIKGDTITWEFLDFEPTEKDNLRLEFIPFWIYDKMLALRTQIKQDPQAVKPRLELARLYFATIWGKGFNYFLPWDLDEKRFNEEILQKIAKKADRDYFLSSYEKDGKTGLYGPNFKLSGDNLQRIDRLTEILNATGYKPDVPYTAWFKPFMQEAETMLKEAIALDARNAEAWNTYLYYYPRLHYVKTFMHIPLGQKELIRRGAAACPEDPLLRLWLELIDDNMKSVPENIGELEYLSGSLEWWSPMMSKQVGFSVDDELIKRIGRYYDQRAIVFYSKIKRDKKGGYEATTVDLKKAGASSLQKKILTLFHGRKRFTYELVLKKKPLTPEQKDEIVQLLSRSGFFSFLYSQKIEELAEKSGIVVDNMKIWKEINLSE